MYIPKQYGKSKIDSCPFCANRATVLNKQNIPVCEKHKTAMLGDMKCACGEELEMKTGKFGIYFSCIRCGNLNLNKVLTINNAVDVSKKQAFMEKTAASAEPPEKKTQRNITITSDDIDYF